MPWSRGRINNLLRDPRAVGDNLVNWRFSHDRLQPFAADFDAVLIADAITRLLSTCPPFLHDGNIIQIQPIVQARRYREVDRRAFGQDVLGDAHDLDRHIFAYGAFRRRQRVVQAKERRI